MKSFLRRLTGRKREASSQQEDWILDEDETPVPVSKRPKPSVPAPQPCNSPRNAIDVSYSSSRGFSHVSIEAHIGPVTTSFVLFNNASIHVYMLVLQTTELSI